ncbi:hypothetical protein GPA10_12215 [Streptomyces sp. p1417]|uniref:STAS domain-containing protein n=1 Tax=Streptomyces typhae TaxID=2681492 RepID=A0A6L6WX33_9ACTN|nr:hypothetical protein [Streptomyces typhae]MVO85496.1 hypothetical protein [Streptomyces typhae]
MRGYFTDDQLLMLPLADHPGLRLHGEALSAHRGPLVVALTDEATRTEEIVIDLTDVRFLANSVLETLVLLAIRLSPPQHLLVRGGAGLKLRERIAARGWDRVGTLQLADG